MIKWGIIGCGRISHRFMQGLQHITGAVFLGAWSRRPETVDAFINQYGGTAFRSLDELLNSDVDAIYIATLPDSHKHYSIAALKAGKHVLCEKPSTVNITELDEVLAVARETGRLFMEGMKPPFFPLYRKLKEHLAIDPVGPIGYVRAGSAVNDLTLDHPNFSYEGIGGSLMAIAPYEAFLAVDWLGQVNQVQTLGRFGETGVDLFSIFQSQHEGGFAQLYCGLDLHGKGDALLTGPKGHITIHKNWWNPAKATINYLDGRVVELDEPFEHGGLIYETEHFCELIRNGQTESPIITHEFSRQMIHMLDESRRQIGLTFPGE